MGAVTPGETLGTLYNIHVGSNKTKQHLIHIYTVLAVWVWGNAEKVLRETPPSCSNLPTKSFPFSEKVFMPALRHAELASLIFVPGYGQYGSVERAN